MDKELIQERFTRARLFYDQQAVVQHEIVMHMLTLFEDYIPASAHKRVWEIGCGTGLFTKNYIGKYKPKDLLLNDLCPEMKEALVDVLNSHVNFVPGDAENMLPEGQFSMIVACSVLQWFVSPFNFLQKCQDILEDDGYIALSLFGEQNMNEIRILLGDTLPYYSLEVWKKELIKIGYQIIHVSEMTRTLMFDSPLEVLQHLKKTGVTGINRKQWTKGMLTSFQNNYIDSFSAKDGSVLLTYHPMYIIIKKIKK